MLNNVTLNIAAGEHIALLGRTGCGKSTLLQLLTRAWNADSGQILLNDQPLASYDEATLRAMTTVVSQRVHIFSSTLRENLRIAAPAASDEDLNLALQQVGLDKLLENEGLNAWLGEGGRQLSGGEQRRLGIARALLHQAPLLLLDEPTEGLDAETEQQNPGPVAPALPWQDVNSGDSQTLWARAFRSHLRDGRWQYCGTRQPCSADAPAWPLRPIPPTYQ